MKQTKVVLIDDVDGSPADQTLAFAFNGISYEIDLTDAHAKEFTEGIEKWLVHSRRVGGRINTATRRAGRRTNGNAEAALIRTWAQENGLQVSDRGRIPASIVEQYRAAKG